MKLTGQQEKLLAFVKLHHGDQQRKYVDEPYWKHLYRVAGIVNNYINGAIEIALCHDLLEDTSCTENELRNFLLHDCNYSLLKTNEICSGVVALTDVYTSTAFPKLNRRERKKRENERLALIEPFFQSVKYADIIDNTDSIVVNAPGFAPKYLDEMVQLINVIRKGDIRLLIRCCYSVHKGLLALKKDRL